MYTGDGTFLQQELEDEEERALQQALKQSAEEAARGPHHAAFIDPAPYPGGMSEEQALQQALRESSAQGMGIRKLMRAEGPFLPAGLANSGNSCFWNALLQVLFAITPVLRGALFQLEEKAAVGDPVLDMQALCLMRDLFAEMDMGLADAIDAAALYQRIFQTREEADVSEQMHHVFRLTLSGGPSPLRSVFSELFSGDLYEHLSEGSVRSVPLELCQLDLCVTEPTALENLLEEHTCDVHGSISRRSYRLPPVLWLNLDRFVYDPVTQQGQKRDVRVTIPEVLNTWMLMPPEAPWLTRVREKARRVQELKTALKQNCEEVTRHGPAANRGCSLEAEQMLRQLVERQEAIVADLEKVDKELARAGAEQELLYHLEAVIVHRGQIDSGHYFSYVRSPDEDNPGCPAWCCQSDANVQTSTLEEMRRVCEGGDAVEEATNGYALALLPVPTRTDSTQSQLSQGGSRPAEAEASPQSIGGGSTPSKQPGKRVLPSLTSFLGCFPRRGPRGQVGSETLPVLRDQPRGEGQGVADDGTADQGDATANTPLVSRGASNPSDPVERSAEASEPGKPRPPPSTSARCLIYVRRGEGGRNLLEEVKLRVPKALQAKIDAQNKDLLRQNVEMVADDFVRCIRQLTAHVPSTGFANGQECPQRLEEALKKAMLIRADGGMGLARMYLLREAWRSHIPWLPEELTPASSPPDFRMHYGSNAKRFLLDALIKRGQHDVASLLTADAQRTDVLVPTEVESWLSSRGF